MLSGLFSPKPPLPVREKAWTEVRMGWLARQFGINRLRDAEVVLHDDRWLREDYAGTAGDARRFLDHLAGFMQTDPSSIQFKVGEDEGECGDACQRQPGVLCLSEGQLADLPRLAAVLSRELAVQMLANHGLLQSDRDAEWVADLLPLYLGLGVFTANAALSEGTEAQGRHGRCATRRHGCLNPCMIGYALALFAWVRDERSPEWGKFLLPEAADMLASGLRYLHATKDSLLSLETSYSADRPTPWCALLEQIEGNSLSACVAGLWELAQRPRDAREDLGQAVPLLQRRLSDRSAAIRAEAARCLAALGPATEPALDDLIQCLDDTDGEVRVAVVYALGRLAMQPETVLPHLLEALDDRALVRPAAVAIAAYGPPAGSEVPKLAAALLQALAETEYDNVDALVCAVEATAADPAAELRRVLDDCDAESRPQAEQILAHCHPVSTGAGAPGAWFGEWRQ